jgi:hypothetical protein
LLKFDYSPGPRTDTSDPLGERVRLPLTFPHQPYSASMSFMDELKKIPPVTRFLCGVTIVETVSTMLEIVSDYRVVYAKELAIDRGEVMKAILYIVFES